MTVVALGVEPFAAERSLPRHVADVLGLECVDLRPFERGLRDMISLREGADSSPQASLWTAAADWDPRPADLAARVSELILEKALQDDVLIVSYFAPMVLRALPHTVTALVRGDDDFRAERILKRVRYPHLATAHIDLGAEDGAIWRTARALFGADWRRAAFFDLTIDAERGDAGSCAAAIGGALEHPRCQVAGAALLAVRAQLESLIR